MQTFFYNIFIRLYPAIAFVVAPFNAKAKQWLLGRKNLFRKIEQAFADESRPVIWMHCASLGEFEQGRPVLERLKETYPTHCLLLTFFSPSGYEVQKNYTQADYIFYLPMDSKSNATKFIAHAKPVLAIFIKYEFWHYYLQTLKEKQIPCLLVSGIFRPSQPFFQWYGSFHRAMLHSFTHLFVQNENSKQLLQTYQFENVSVSGDSRFDRVLEIRNQFTPIELIEQFCSRKSVIVAGSTWTKDDEALAHFANTHPHIRFVIAPHNIDKNRLKECKKLYNNAVLFSAYKQENTGSSANTLIIDNVGMLSRLYAYATVCYVGGAFDTDGVHNVLEPSVYGKPVVFGPVYDKYIEAVELINHEGAISVKNRVALENILSKLLLDHAFYKSTGNKAAEYVKNKSGATEKVVQWVLHSA